MSKDAAELLTATCILTGARLARGVVLQLFQGIPAMRDSSAYQIILDEGRVEAVKSVLLQQGRMLIGPPPKEVKAALASIDDLKRLKRMAACVLSATSWEELLSTK